MDGEAYRQKLIAHLERKAAARGFDIVDVEVQGSAKAALVRVYLDHDDPHAAPITLDEIAEANSWIGDGVEELALYNGPYTLEVSSPGMARPLRRQKDFERFVGEKARIRMKGYEGRRNFSGIIRAVDNGVLSLETQEETIELPLAHMAKALLIPTYDNL